MTLLDELHSAHKQRIARIENMAIKPEPEPETIIGPSQADFDSLVKEVATLRKQSQTHTGLIAKLITTEADEKPKFGEIIDSVCEYYSVSRNDLLSARRTADLTLPRMIVCYLGRSLTGMSFPQMGRRLGGRDHTTALHGANKIKENIKSDETLRDDIDVLGMKISEKVMQRKYGNNVSAFPL